MQALPASPVLPYGQTGLMDGEYLIGPRILSIERSYREEVQETPYNELSFSG